jgi:hypothetical protein
MTTKQRKKPRKTKGKRRTDPTRPLKVKLHTDIPEPTEDESAVLKLLSDSLRKADASARALGRFEADELMPRMPDGQASDEELSVEFFRDINQDLGQLSFTKELIKFYGLETFEKTIMDLLIHKLFEPRPARPKQKQVFKGTDEQLLEHQTRESD